MAASNAFSTASLPENLKPQMSYLRMAKGVCLSDRGRVLKTGPPPETPQIKRSLPEKPEVTQHVLEVQKAVQMNSSRNAPQHGIRDPNSLTLPEKSNKSIFNLGNRNGG